MHTHACISVFPGILALILGEESIMNITCMCMCKVCRISIRQVAGCYHKYEQCIPSVFPPCGACDVDILKDYCMIEEGFQFQTSDAHQTFPLYSNSLTLFLSLLHLQARVIATMFLPRRVLL